MKIGYVVLYVTDPAASLTFWIEKFGMIEKSRNVAGTFIIPRVGFADQDFSFELVPLELMQNNPDNLNLASPSIAFYVHDLQATHATLRANGVECTDIADHSGQLSFGFSDNEKRWFAALEG
jgi:catechol 2,3-dioxygenase-like lactoylglutathione lyase family enzyme